MKINSMMPVAFATVCTLAAGCSGKIGEPGGWITPPSESGGGGSGGSSGSGGSGGMGSGGSSPKEWEPPACVASEKAFAPARLWQLTDQEYVNVVRDVLGVTLTGADADITTAASNSGVFSNMSEGRSITLTTAKNYQIAAEKVATL